MNLSPSSRSGVAVTYKFTDQEIEIAASVASAIEGNGKLCTALDYFVNEKVDDRQSGNNVVYADSQIIECYLRCLLGLREDRYANCVVDWRSDIAWSYRCFPDLNSAVLQRRFEESGIKLSLR